MATASKLFKDVKIKLEMTATEAAVIHEILRHVGGDENRTLRGATDEIRRALETALVYQCPYTKINNNPFKAIHNAIDANICFEEFDLSQLEANLQFHLANT